MKTSALREFLSFEHLKSAIPRVDRIILAFLLYLPVIDSINGIMKMNELPAIAQPIKFGLLALIFLRILSESSFFAIVGLLLFIPFLVSDFVNIFHVSDIFYFGSDLGTSFKHSFFTIPLIYLFMLFRKIGLAHANQVYKQIFIFGFVSIAINLLCGGLGLGYPQYVMWTPSGERIDIGTTGFFFDGNSIAALLVLFSGSVAYEVWYIKRIYFFIFLIFCMYLSYLKATKVALLGPFVILAILPFCMERTRIWILTRLKVVYFIVLIAFSGIAGPIVFNSVLSSAAGSRLVDMWENADLTTFVLSGRNHYLRAAWNDFEDTYTPTEIAIGRGYRATESASSVIETENHTIELDFFDILFQKGVLGIFFSYGFWIFFTILSFYLTFFKRYGRYTAVIFFQNFLFIFLSFLSGHIVGSAVLGVYFAILNALLLCTFFTNTYDSFNNTQTH